MNNKIKKHGITVPKELIVNQKQILDAKNEKELKNYKNKLGNFYSIMEDYCNIISLNKFRVAEIGKMLNKENLLEELAIFYADDERVIALQQKILQEYLCYR